MPYDVHQVGRSLVAAVPGIGGPDHQSGRVELGHMLQSLRDWSIDQRRGLGRLEDSLETGSGSGALHIGDPNAGRGSGGVTSGAASAEMVRRGRGASLILRAGLQQWLRDRVMRSSGSRIGVADRLVRPAGGSVPAGSQRHRSPGPRQPDPVHPRRRAPGRAGRHAGRPWTDACDRA